MEPPSAHCQAVEVDIQGQKALVFRWIGDSAELAEEAGAGFWAENVSGGLVADPLVVYQVWLQLQQVGLQPQRDALEGSAPIGAAFELPDPFASLFREREIGVLEGWGPQDTGRSIDRLVKGAAQIGDEANGVPLHLVRDVLDDPDFMNSFVGLAVIVSEVFDIGVIEKGALLGVKLLDVSTRKLRH